MYKIVMAFGIGITLLSAARIAWAKTNTDQYCLAFVTYQFSSDTSGGDPGLHISEEFTLHCATHTCAVLCAHEIEKNGTEAREFCKCPGGGEFQCTVVNNWNATASYGTTCLGNACCSPKVCRMNIVRTITQHPGPPPYKTYDYSADCKCE